ncbi:hypothetical protein LN050_01955 [Comamonadaceae bacterium M7527]|nr:hypothetical protein LN050_01955 [Comamonadaceae bacterium M7527]
MKHTLLALAVMAYGSVAFAHGCPGEMKQIDAKLPAAMLGAADMTTVKELRARGEAEHKAGKHSASMASLGEAKKLLGL